MGLRERLGRGEILVAPGVYDALTARLVESAGFEAAYLSGAGVSYSHLAQPDVGLVTLPEMTERLRCVAGRVAIPIVADGDNGHGNAMNVMRTVALFEAAGAAAVQLEDQTFPKRCGHLDGKSVIPAAEMVGKIRAACAARRSRDFLIVARTDAASILGLDEALARARAYREAGADVLFVESPRDRAELLAVSRALAGVPLVANMVEGGKTELLDNAELQELGYRIVLYPNSLVRLFGRAGAELLATLRRAGTTRSEQKAMLSFAELNDLVGQREHAAREAQFLGQPGTGETNAGARAPGEMR